MEHTKISIITVVYNDVKNIELTIKNSLNQSYQNLELIVVDGASYDGTTEIVKKYDGKIKWISEKDTGIYDAMNKGAKLATGDWLLYHNSGDFFMSNEAISQVFNDLNIDQDITFIICNIRAYNGYGYKDLKPNILKKHYFEEMPVYHPATFIRRDWQLSKPYDTSFRNSGDYDFFVKSFKEGAKYLHIDQTIVLNDCSQGTTAQNFTTTLKEDIRLLTSAGANIQRIQDLNSQLKHKKRIYKLCKIIPFFKLLVNYRMKQHHKKGRWIKTDRESLYNFLSKEQHK